MTIREQIEAVTNAISRLEAALAETPGVNRSPKLENDDRGAQSTVRRTRD